MPIRTKLSKNQRKKKIDPARGQRQDDRKTHFKEEKKNSAIVIQTDSDVLSSKRLLSTGYGGNGRDRTKIESGEYAGFDHYSLDPSKPGAFTDETGERNLIVFAGELKGVNIDQLEEDTLDHCDQVPSDKISHRGPHENRSYGCHCQRKKEPCEHAPGLAFRADWRRYLESESMRILLCVSAATRSDAR